MRADLFGRLFWLALGALGIAGLFAYSAPLWDMDLWWHLASGRNILEQGGLPDADPFNFTSPTGPTGLGYRSIILTGYWLSEVFFYLVSNVSGYSGLIALRAVLLLGILSLLAVSSLRVYRAGATTTLLALTFCLIISTDFTGMRPQLFSFLMAPLLVLLLEEMSTRLEQGKNIDRFFFIVPLLTMLWANLHRGFMVAAPLIGIFLISRVPALIKRGPGFDMRRESAYLAILALGLLGTLLNPSSYLPYLELFVFEGSELQGRVSEYLSPLALYERGRHLYGFWAYLVLSGAVALLNIRRAPLRHSLLVLPLAVAGLGAFRYIPFFVFISAPITALGLSSLMAQRPAYQRHLRAAALAFVLISSLFVISGNLDNMGRALRSPVVEGKYPDKALVYMREDNVPGPIFNHYNWGGYISWKAREYKTFIAGRVFS